jgi:hypothetical protein
MNLPRGTQGLTKSSRFRSYFVAIVVAILTVSFRCIYRIPELGGSYRNAVSRSQIDFVVLDGIMISIAILALTLAHPAIAFMGCLRRRFRRERQSLNLRVGNQSLCWSQRRAPSAQVYRRSKYKYVQSNAGVLLTTYDRLSCVLVRLKLERHPPVDHLPTPPNS